MPWFVRHPAVQPLLPLVVAAFAVLACPAAAREAVPPGGAPQVTVGRPFSTNAAAGRTDLRRLDLKVLTGEKLELLVDNTSGGAPLTICLLGAEAGAHLQEEVAAAGCDAGSNAPSAGPATVPAGARDRVTLTFTRPPGRPFIRFSSPGPAATRRTIEIEKLIPATGITHGDRDQLAPLLAASSRPPRLRPDRAELRFYVGGLTTVTHRVTYRGRELALRTVRCTAAGPRAVRLTFTGAARRTMGRLLANKRADTLTWTLAATDPWGNTTRRKVRVRA